MSAQANGASSPISFGLVAEPAVVLPAAGQGPALPLSAGRLSGGGHALAWLAQGDGALHLQYFDTQGQPADAATVLRADPAPGPTDLAVLPDGSFVVASVLAGAASDYQPWITRTAIAVQRHDRAGAPVGAAVQIGVVEQDRIGAATMRYVTDPAIARRDDGSFVVGWSQVEEDASGRAPRFRAQSFDAQGRPVGAPIDAGKGDRGTSFRLVAAPAGGWILTTFRRTFGRSFLQFAAFEGATAPQLPPGSIGFAEGSLLVPLAGGRSVLLAPAHVYGSLQMYGADGQPARTAGALSALPVAAAPLADGGFVTFTGMEGELVAQRFDAAGRTCGEGVATAAGAVPVLVAPLEGGAVAIAWRTRAGELASQRLR